MLLVTPFFSRSLLAVDEARLRETDEDALRGFAPPERGSRSGILGKVLSNDMGCSSLGAAAQRGLAGAFA